MCSELERNRIRVIHGLVFQGLDSVVQLRLKHNAISDLMDGAFWGLTKIQLLYVLCKSNLILPFRELVLLLIYVKYENRAPQHGLISLSAMFILLS